MTPLSRLPLLRGAAVLTLSALVGCASHEALPSYYVLTATAPGAAGNHTSRTGARILIREVALPGYLKLTRIASRRADNQIEYATSALWGENLKEGFGHALAEALAQEPGIGFVDTAPQSLSPSHDYDLAVEVERFEGNERGEVSLVARWQIYRVGSAVPRLSGRSHFVQNGWVYGDEAGQARLLSLDVRELAEQIAREIRSGTHRG